MDANPHIIDTLPFATEFVLVLTALIASLVTAFLYSALKQVGLDGVMSEKAVREGIEQLLGRATKYGLARLADSGVAEITTTSDAVAEAVRYALKRGPAALRKIGITDTEDGRADLTEMINARLADEVGDRFEGLKTLFD